MDTSLAGRGRTFGQGGRHVAPRHINLLELIAVEKVLTCLQTKRQCPLWADTPCQGLDMLAHPTCPSSLLYAFPSMRLMMQLLHRIWIQHLRYHCPY